MTDTEPNAVTPSGVDLTVMDNGFVIIRFEGCAVPPIRLHGQSAKTLGSSMQSVGHEAIGETHE